MVGPITNSCPDSNISNSLKMISDLLCYMGVKKGFLHANILAFVLGVGGGASVLKVSLGPGISVISIRGGFLWLVTSLPCFIPRQELSLISEQ